MPAKPRKSKVDPALADIRAQIREAEKAQVPVTREMVGLSLESLNTVVRLIKTGHYGKKPMVLQQALAIGLEALDRTAGAERYEKLPPDELPPAAGQWPEPDEPPSSGNAPDLEPLSLNGSSLLGGATGGGYAFGQSAAPPAVVPPSQLREHSAETGDADE